MRLLILNHGLIPTAMFSLVLGACGSSGPDIDQVKKDFESPSGSTKDKNGLIAAGAKQSSADDNEALSLAGGGFLGLGLRSEDSRGGFAAISPVRMFEPRARQLFSRYEGRRLGFLRTADSDIDSDCFDSNAYQEALVDAAQSGSREFSFEFSVDDLSACDSDLSGGIDFAIKVKAEEDGSSFEYMVEYKFNAVRNTSENTSLDGSMALEMSASTTGTNAGQLRYVLAWDLTLGEENRTLTSRGGQRLGFSSDDQGNGSAQYEFLHYVADGSGNEVSYVVTYTANTQGQSTLSIRGDDGEVNCSFNETTGAGQCDGDLSWTEADYDAVTESEAFLGG